MDRRTILTFMTAKTDQLPGFDGPEGRMRPQRGAESFGVFRWSDRVCGLVVFLLIRAALEALRPAFDLYCWATVQRSSAEGYSPRPGTSQPSR